MTEVVVLGCVSIGEEWNRVNGIGGNEKGEGQAAKRRERNSEERGKNVEMGLTNRSMTSAIWL